MAINVGDLVRVTERMFCYSQWGEMFRQMGFRNDEERNNPYQNGDVLRVFSIQPHPMEPHTTLYGLEHPTTLGSTQILINQRGIEWVLPGKFAVRVTPDIKEALNNWRGGGLLNTNDGYCLSLNQGYWVSSLENYSEYILITTEQFRQYVLNQTTTDMPVQDVPTNLENEQEDSVVTTKDRVICMTDKWNYINLGEVYEVIKRDEYYTYVKDSVGGESRYAHHYFEEWVHEDLKAKREQFRNLFGDHSEKLFRDGGDEVKKLLAELYPKLYKYNDWIKLERNTSTSNSYLPFSNNGNPLDLLLLTTDYVTRNESLHGYLRFDNNDLEMNTLQYNGYTYIRFRQRN